MNIDVLTVDSARTAVLEKQTTATEMVDDFYKKIAAEDPAIGGYLTLCEVRAYQQAARIDELADKGDGLPPLAGVPIAVKDVFATKGRAHDRRLEDPGKLHLPVRCDGGDPAGRSRRNHLGQDQLRRVRHGLVE